MSLLTSPFKNDVMELKQIGMIHTAEPTFSSTGNSSEGPSWLPVDQFYQSRHLKQFLSLFRKFCHFCLYSKNPFLSISFVDILFLRGPNDAEISSPLCGLPLRKRASSHAFFSNVPAVKCHDISWSV